MPNSTIAGNVQRRRRDLGLSRERLAVTADTSVSTIQRLERDGRVPSLDILARIARALSTTTGALLEEAA